LSEPFVFDVAYSTSFEDIEKLREKMLAFVTAEKRDYHPVFDVTIKGALVAFRKRSATLRDISSHPLIVSLTPHNPIRGGRLPGTIEDDPLR